MTIITTQTQEEFISEWKSITAQAISHTTAKEIRQAAEELGITLPAGMSKSNMGIRIVRERDAKMEEILATGTFGHKEEVIEAQGEGIQELLTALKAKNTTPAQKKTIRRKLRKLGYRVSEHRDEVGGE